MTDIFIAYTDGACTNNQASGGQPGGWGVAFIDGRKLSGSSPSTTNNRMELTAAIEALKSTPSGSNVEINSDSAYVVNAFNQHWIPNWIKRGWKTSSGKDVENQDLWKVLIGLAKDRNVTWKKVKGHSGDKWNDIADKLATEAITNALNHKVNSNSSDLLSHNDMNEINIAFTMKQIELLTDVLKKNKNVNQDLDELLQHLQNYLK